MHTLKKKVVISPKERRLRTKEHRVSFLMEVDSGKIAEYINETAFEDYMTSIQSKSEFAQKEMKTEGSDCMEFKVFCPFPFFCALVSQITFDRNSDMTFRYLFF